MQTENIVNKFVETVSENFRVQFRILQDHAHQLTEENKKLKARIDQLETFKEEMDKSADAVGNSSLLGKMSLVKRQIDGLQRQLRDAKAYIVTLQDEIQHLNREITEMQKAQKLKLATLPNLQHYQDEQFGGGLAHAFSGSLSDCLRRGELKYLPNGEVRENGSRMHKSYSTRDLFSGDDSRSTSSHQRGYQQPSFLIEFPPTLPRRGNHDMNYRPVSKSRSYVDLDDTGRAEIGGRSHGRRYDAEQIL